MLHFLAIQLFLSAWENRFEHRYRSPAHVFVIKRNILIIRFARYFLLASNNTFMTDSQYLGTIQIWQNLNEDHYYLTSLQLNLWFVNYRQIILHSSRWICFLHQVRTLKTNLLQFIILNLAPFFSFSYLHTFPTLEFESNYFLSCFEK